MIGKYKIITLCGSARFLDDFKKMQKKLTLEGKIVMTINNLSPTEDSAVWTDELKSMLDDMHKRKIDLSDEIMVINKGGYIGASTRSEIEYATKLGKKIYYMEQ